MVGFNSPLVSLLFLGVFLIVSTVVGETAVDGSTDLRHSENSPGLSGLNRAIGQILARRDRHGGGGRGGRRRDPAKKYYKPLLRALKREDRRELKQIIRGDVSKAEIAERVQKWVQQKNDPKTTEAFDLFQQVRELMRKLKAIGEENFLDGKSKEARALYAQLKQVKEDQSLTWDQTCTRRNEILHAADQEAVHELRRKGRPCNRNDSWSRLTGLGGGGKKPEEEDK